MATSNEEVVKPSGPSDEPANGVPKQENGHASVGDAVEAKSDLLSGTKDEGVGSIEGLAPEPKTKGLDGSDVTKAGTGEATSAGTSAELINSQPSVKPTSDIANTLSDNQSAQDADLASLQDSLSAFTAAPGPDGVQQPTSLPDFSLPTNVTDTSTQQLPTSTAEAGASAFDFLPFFPNGTSDMNRLAEAWQQSQAELAAAAAEDRHHAEQNGMMNGDLGAQNAQLAASLSATPNGTSTPFNNESGQADAGLLLGISTLPNGQAGQSHQGQIQNALAVQQALSQVSGGGGADPMALAYGNGTTSEQAQAAVAAASAAAEAQGISPAYAIAAALAAQSQRPDQNWDYNQLAHLTGATPYSNPSYSADIAAYNQQQQHTQSGHDHTQPSQSDHDGASGSQNPNTLGGHTHRPGSGHAFCTGDFVEGTEYRRFVFPLGQDVSAGRKKHVKSAQEMADTFPLAQDPCDRCAGYDNPLPCFHQDGSKCVYCKFLSKPCSLQPGGTNNKERKAETTLAGQTKKKRKTTHDGDDTTEAAAAAIADALAQHQQRGMSGFTGGPGMNGGSMAGIMPGAPQLNLPTSADQSHQVAQDLAAVAQQHRIDMQNQAQAVAAIQQAQAMQQMQQQQQLLGAPQDPAASYQTTPSGSPYPELPLPIEQS